jgi:tetratricopeptide (TPR) repeat protein
MTTEPKDASTALDAMEEIVELQRADPDMLLPELATMLLGLQGNSRHRPRLHRLLGTVQNRLSRHKDALQDLGEAKALAQGLSPPDYRELAKIGRETAAIHALRGNTQRAAGELLTALALASLAGDAAETARITAAVGHLDLEAGRFDVAVLLFRQLLTKEGMKLPPHEAFGVRLGLCQALNRLGRYHEAAKYAATLYEDLPRSEPRRPFLAKLEEARAEGGLGRHDEAERALLEAEKLLPEKESALEHSEFIQAVTELQERKEGAPAATSLAQLIEHYGAEGLPVRQVVARRALAEVLLRAGEAQAAQEAMAQGLRQALQNGLADVAEEIRAKILAHAGPENFQDLAETTDVLGGGGAQRILRLRRVDQDGADEDWLGIDLADGNPVALKAVDLGSLAGPQRDAAMATIKTAAEAAARIDDPLIARLVALRVAQGGTLYVVHRDVEGETLHALYASGAPPARLLELLADVAEALANLHAQGLVHLDLTPQNVIVTRDEQGPERPVLIGLDVLSGVRPKAPAHFAMSPYAAPEQGTGAPVDGRADVYSLGQMIAEIWGGNIPARSGLGKLWHREAQDEMPRAIGDIVLGMLETDPARRTGDLSYVAEALRSQARQLANG